MSEPLRFWILLVRSLLFALFLIERHRSQNHGSLKSEERLSDFKERCAQLCLFRNTAMKWTNQRRLSVLFESGNVIRLSKYGVLRQKAKSI